MEVVALGNRDEAAVKSVGVAFAEDREQLRGDLFEGVLGVYQEEDGDEAMLEAQGELDIVAL